MKAVVPLAKRLGSHIVGVHAEPLPVPMTTGLGFPDAEFVITTGEINRKRASELETLFKARLDEAQLPFEWHAIESFSGTARSPRAPSPGRPIWSWRRKPDRTRPLRAPTSMPCCTTPDGRSCWCRCPA